jgi:putative oxidoreductase
MAEAASRLYVPSLGGIYGAANAYAEPILRIGLGAVLIPHGMQKLFGAFGGMGLTNNAALFERLGYTPGMFWGTLVGCTELVGGILLVLGLFTRFAAGRGADLHDRGREVHLRQRLFLERRRL